MFLQKKIIAKVVISLIALFVVTSYSAVQYTQAADPGIVVNDVATVSARSSDGVWGQPYQGPSTPYVAPALKYNGKQVLIVREAQTNYGAYEQFTVNGQIVGWLDKRAFSSISPTYNNAVSKAGVVKAASTDSIWVNPYAGGGNTYVAAGTKYNNQLVQIVREAKTIDGTYEQFTVNGHVVGWLDKRAFSVIGQVNYNNAVNNIGQINAASYDGIWSDPYLGPGTPFVTQASKYNGKQVQIVREAQTNYGTYEQFTVNGHVVGWLDKRAFSTIGQVNYNNAVNNIGQISAASYDGIWSDPYLGPGTPYVTQASKYNGKQVQIVREAQTNYGTYEQFTVNGQVVGWLDKKAFSSIGQTYYNNAVNEAGVVKAASYDSIWTNPYAGGANTYVAAGTKYNNQLVQIVREAKTTYGTYEQFTTNGQVVGWLDKKAFSTIGQVNYNNTMNAVGQINAASYDGIWSVPYLGSGTPYVASGSSYDGQQAQIVRESQTNFGTYYQFTVNGRLIGWLDKRAFSSVQSLSDYTEIDLRKPSDITAQDIVNFFNKYNPNSPLKTDAQSFINAQNTYGVNAQYLLAHAILETGWGEQSDLYTYKHNLYGYGAYDVAPFTCGYYFPTDSESINFTASQIRYNYLNATGIYYDSAYGPTLKGMNVNYATDPNWAGGIAAIMQEIKPLDPAYYANTAEKASSSQDTSTYQTNIPAGQPVPSDVVINFPTGTLANVVNTSSVNMRSLPYVTTSTLLRSVGQSTPVAVLGYNTDVRYDPSGSDNYVYRWYRVSIGGQNGWIYGEYLNIENLLQVVNVTSGDLNIRTDTSTSSGILYSVANGTYLSPVMNSSGQLVTTSGWYEVHVPNSPSVEGWVSSSFVSQIKQ
ncbi:GW domain-containing glycosaminoglycan-binding protein [Sporolactobacillus pectinivorans]|uniref:GW domain-containing glycosaminoglycan-binding protein n=1 Tax=Sporolactobacillus pectinivorans TaxID=1591408 RepID=UPI000C265B30|nr:GW domain-containing glycosaminoglycan-binding protein [Sporolactobacillus pectinivorans]